MNDSLHIKRPIKLTLSCEGQPAESLSLSTTEREKINSQLELVIINSMYQTRYHDNVTGELGDSNPRGYLKVHELSSTYVK